VIAQNQTMIACGQLRMFPEAQELGSLVVSATYRGQGLGTLLAQHLIQMAAQPLYLECLGMRLCQFYSRLGFKSVSWTELPRSLQLKFGLSSVAKTVLRVPVQFMHYQGRHL
jgi:amino-acid N-acetyltransferase